MNDTIDTNTPTINDNEPKRILYFVLVAFNGPQEGTVQVHAHDKDHAAELTKQLLAHAQDLKIIDVYSAEEVQQQAASMAPAPTVLQ